MGIQQLGNFSAFKRGTISISSADSFMEESGKHQKFRAMLDRGQSFGIDELVKAGTGWWFGCHFLFSHILGIIIPIDVHIFQRGGPTTNQGKCFGRFLG